MLEGQEGVEDGQLVSNGYGVSLGEDEKVPGMDG